MTQFAKWLRGRDLNPRPLGYENYLALSRLFRSITYLSVVSSFLPLVARFCGVIVAEESRRGAPELACDSHRNAMDCSSYRVVRILSVAGAQLREFGGSLGVEWLINRLTSTRWSNRTKPETAEHAT